MRGMTLVLSISAFGSLPKLASSFSTPAPAVAPEPPVRRVAIIGAGISGLSKSIIFSDA